jgi:hypothetical protein
MKNSRFFSGFLSKWFSYALPHQFSCDSEPPPSIVSTAYSVRYNLPLIPVCNAL